MRDRYAVVDLGSNTIRLLVADVADGRVEHVDGDSAMARLVKAIGADGRLGADKVREVAETVSAWVERANLLGATDVRIIATAAVREASNQDDLAEAIRRAVGLPLDVIDGEEEARLAFTGAVSSLEEDWDGAFAVVDVGGGSTEVVVGSMAGGISWARSYRLGSGAIADRYLEHDPPRPAELARARRAVEDRLHGDGELPQVANAVAVGGSARNVRKLVGPILDEESLLRAIRLLGERPAAQISRQFDVGPERARVLGGGALILEAAARGLGCALMVGRTGLREGAVLELAQARAA